MKESINSSRWCNMIGLFFSVVFFICSSLPNLLWAFPNVEVVELQQEQDPKPSTKPSAKPSVKPSANPKPSPKPPKKPSKCGSFQMVICTRTFPPCAGCEDLKRMLKKNKLCDVKPPIFIDIKKTYPDGSKEKELQEKHCKNLSVIPVTNFPGMKPKQKPISGSDAVADFLTNLKCCKGVCECSDDKYGNPVYPPVCTPFGKYYNHYKNKKEVTDIIKLINWSGRCTSNAECKDYAKDVGGCPESKKTTDIDVVPVPIS